MRSLEDVQVKMSSLYEAVESGSIELKKADTLANIAGKYLKAEQLALAREIFMDGKLKAAQVNANAAAGERRLRDAREVMREPS